MLATRFHSYCGNWERLMRQIEEGKFVRKLEKLRGGSAAPPKLEKIDTTVQSEKLYLFPMQMKIIFRTKRRINAACEHKFIDAGNLFIDNTRSLFAS
jgi:hypothetical protein